MKHQDDKALAIMIALEGRSEDSTARRDFEEIKASIALEQNPVVKRNTKPWFRLILGVGSQAMQQLTAINVICYYLPYVLTESVGLSGSIARLLAAVNAMTYLFSTFIGLCFVERWGRRRLMMYGALGQCCCWLAITILLKIASQMDLLSARQQQLSSAAVLFFFLFNCFFGASWQGVSWLYPTEINSTQNRIAGMSYGVATNWLINFGVVFVTPLGIARLGAHFYAIWTVLNGMIGLIIYVFYPETSGRSLEEIDGMFEEHATVWIFTKKSMTVRKVSTSNASQNGGDDSPIEDDVTTLSRNVSGIELAAAPKAKLRRRSPGPVRIPLENMTPLTRGQKNTKRVADRRVADGRVADNAARAVEERGSGEEGVEEDEDAIVMSLQLAAGSTRASKTELATVTHAASSKVLV